MTLLPRDLPPDDENQKAQPEWLEMTTARIAQEYQDMAKEIERLRKENKAMRTALAVFADKHNYSVENPDAGIGDIVLWVGNEDWEPWGYARSEIDKLESSE